MKSVLIQQEIKEINPKFFEGECRQKTAYMVMNKLNKSSMTLIENICDSLIFIYGLILFSIATYASTPLLRVIRMSIFAAMIVMLLFSLNRFYRVNKIFYFIIGFVICWAETTIAKHEQWYYSVDLMRFSLLYMVLALVMLGYRHNILPYRILFYITNFIIIFRIIIMKENVENIMLSSSHNYISVILLVFLCLYDIVLIQNKRSISIAPALLYLFMCIIGRGRGGAITAAYFFVMTFIYNYQKQLTNRTFRNIAIIVTLILIFVMRKQILLYFQQDILYERFMELGMDDTGRFDIWRYFISDTFSSLGNFIFGANPLSIRVDANLHNIYLQAYACFGVVFLAVLLYLNLRMIIMMVKTKQYTMLIMFTTLILRSMTDRLFFNGYCEPLLYYFIFYYFMYEKYKNNLFDDGERK